MTNAPSVFLSDIEILKRLVEDDREGKCVFVSPLVDPQRQVGPCSLDVHLGAVIRHTVSTQETHLDLTVRQGVSEQKLLRLFPRTAVGSGGTFVLHPGEFILASTMEFIRLPADIAARLEGRSSIGRLGIAVHATAGFVDPGFEGTLTFELSNVGKLPVKLGPGLRIAQLCFMHVTNVQIPYDGKYQGAIEPTVSRINSGS